MLVMDGELHVGAWQLKCLCDSRRSLRVTALRTRPLDAGPYTFCVADALTMKVREAGLVVNAVVLVATGVDADGHREVLGGPGHHRRAGPARRIGG